MRSRPHAPARTALAKGLALGLTVAVVVGVTLAAFAPSRAEAARFFVPKKYKTIQAAIDAAKSGDTLWVSRGVYRGPFTMKKTLLIFAEAGPESTILDGGDSVRVFHVEGAKGGGIVGFTIRNGKAAAGGGIYCVRDTSFIVDDCVFTKNWESGLAFWACPMVKTGNCTFRENRGSALQFNQSSAFIIGGRFIGNRGQGGAGMYLYQSEILIPARNLYFEDNRADETVGGAIMSDSSRVTLVSCTFKKNTSAVAGGAVGAVHRSFLSISRSEFIENAAAQGGGIHSDQSQVLMGYSLFRDNTSTAGGAAVALVGRYDANVNPIIQNNTFYKNRTNGSGATLFAVKTSPEIRKNIFVVEGADQLAVAGIESSPLYECNLIHDPSGGAVGNLPSGDTLVGDPLFCDPAKGNFDLRDLSPAIRATCGPVGARGVGCKSFQLAPSH